MTVYVTAKCESHRTNPNYRTVLVRFEGNEPNVRPLGLKGDWQPTDDEVIELVERLVLESSTFARKLRQLVVRDE